MKKFSELEYKNFKETADRIFIEIKPRSKKDWIDLVFKAFEKKLSVFTLKQYMNKMESEINKKLDVLGRETRSEKSIS